MSVARWLLVATAFASSGCAVQGTVGRFSSGGGGADRYGGSTLTTIQAFRHSDAVLGVRTGYTIHDGLRINHLALHGGYDILVAPRFTLEPAIEVGAGGPYVERYRGTGSYFGAAASYRLRLFGDYDYQHSFSVMFTGWELVASGRGGVWIPPEGTHSSTSTYGEYGAELGVRFFFGTDLTSGPQGEPRGDEPPTTRPRARVGR